MRKEKGMKGRSGGRKKGKGKQMKKGSKGGRNRREGE